MILHINDTSRTLWFITPALNNAPEGYQIVLGLEVVLYLFCAIVVFRCVWVVLRTKIIHLNMRIIISTFWVQWYEVLIAKILFLPYQYGFIKIDDSNNSCSIWWTAEPSEIIPVQTFEPVIYIYIASLFHWHYAYSKLIGLGVIVFERLFATIYIKDYEKKSRKHISILLILLTNLISTIFTLNIIENRIPMIYALGLIVTYMSTIVIVYFFVLKLNTHLVTYSLSKKFQLKENLRSLMMIRNFVILSGTYTFLACGLLFPIAFRLLDDDAGMLDRLTENIIFMNPIAFSFGIMCCSDVWWQEFIGFRRTTKRDKKVDVIKDETAVYFNQLQNAWA